MQPPSSVYSQPLEPSVVASPLAQKSSPPSNFMRRVSYDAAAKACGFAASGVALRMVGVCFQWPFFGMACGMFSLRLVINVSKEYDLALSHSLNALRDVTWDLVKRYPYFKAISFLVTSALALCSVPLAFLAGLTVGAANALVIGLELALKRQRVHDATVRGDFINQLV